MNTLAVTSPTHLSTIDHNSLLALFLSGLNEDTRRSYGQSLKQFSEWLGEDSLSAAAQTLLSKGHGNANALALRFRIYLLEDRKLAPATVNARLAALRSLVKLSRTLGLVPFELEVPCVRSENYRDTRGPGLEVVRELVKRATEEGKWRDVAIIHLLFDLGLRRTEVARLTLEDIDWDNCRLHILGKGRREQEWLSLPEPTQAALRNWLVERGDAPGSLFDLTPWGVWYVVTSLGEKIGKEVRPHGIRHTAITHALDVTNGNVRTVQSFSRHRNVKTLMIYDDRRNDLGGQVANLVAGGL